MNPLPLFSGNKAPAVMPITAPEKKQTLSAKLGFDAGMLHASKAGFDDAAAEFKPAAIAGAREGARGLTFIFSGSFMFTASVFVPATATPGAGIMLGLLGSGFMCFGAYEKYYEHAPDSLGPATSEVDLASDAES